MKPQFQLGELEWVTFMSFSMFLWKDYWSTANWSKIGIDKNFPGTEAESHLCFMIHRAEVISCEMHFNYITWGDSHTHSFRLALLQTWHWTCSKVTRHGILCERLLSCLWKSALGTFTTVWEGRGWIPDAFCNTVLRSQISPNPEFPRTSLHGHCYVLYSGWGYGKWVMRPLK